MDSGCLIRLHKKETAGPKHNVLNWVVLLRIDTRKIHRGHFIRLDHCLKTESFLLGESFSLRKRQN